MALREVLLTDSLWSMIQPLLSEWTRSSRGGGPPADDRRYFEEILWVLKSGASGKGTKLLLQVDGQCNLARHQSDRSVRAKPKTYRCSPDERPR